MHIKTLIGTLLVFASVQQAFSQELPDTTDIYRDRADSLEATVLVARQRGNTLSKYTPNRVETITAAGLCKMACCNLAESFENSASVTVGYSDAVTGARQIRLLGLSGIYTQMLDENRPVMRGLASPFGLSYVPGQWLESIQIAKGVTSVINGVESLTGQINMEHRKPTDEKPLFLNAVIMNDTKADFNIASSLQLGENWSTVLLGHISGNGMEMDQNKDGFMDDPKSLQLNFANRWLYYSPDGTQVRFGIKALRDARQGGQLTSIENPWQSGIVNTSFNAYTKVGVPLCEDNSRNIAAVLDYTYYNMDSSFGASSYLASQQSGFLNLLYQNEINENHRFTAGAGSTIDLFTEDLLKGAAAFKDLRTLQANAGLFGEYTYKNGEVFSLIAGLRGEWYKDNGIQVSPRLTVKYSPVEDIVIRANAGRGLRYSNPLTDNIGVFSTGKEFVTPGSEGWNYRHTLEDAWTGGGNITWYFPIRDEKAWLSFDYFRSQFVNQAIVDYEYAPNTIAFYTLEDINAKGKSWSDTYQLDFSCEPVERFNITLTGRYTDSRMMTTRGLVERPMTSRYKAVLNLQYTSNLSKWIFDFTASLNGSARVYNFMESLTGADGALLYPDGQTPAYPLLYFQVTRRFKGLDVYLGGENLTNYTQKNIIIGSPSADNFDASCVWGPMMGTRIYAGLRFTLWKY